MAVTHGVGTLHVAAMPSGGDDASTVVLADHGSSAVHAVLNVHPVSINGADLAIGSDAGVTSAFEGDCSAGRRSAGTGASCSARPSGCSALPYRSRLTCGVATTSCGIRSAGCSGSSGG